MDKEDDIVNNTAFFGNQFIVSKTFIDFYDEHEKKKRRGGRRARSLGDNVASDSEPISPVQGKYSPCGKSPCKLDIFVRRDRRAQTQPMSSIAVPQSEKRDEIMVSEVQQVSTTCHQTGHEGHILTQGTAKSCGDGLLQAIEASKSVGEVLDLTARAGSVLSSTQVVASLHQVAKCFEASSQVHLSLNVPCDVRYKTLVANLRASIVSLDNPRLMTRALWSLGKVGSCGADIESIIAHMAAAAPQHVSHYTAQDLSNTLWSLARLVSAPDGSGDHGAKKVSGKARRDAVGFACLVVTEISSRVDTLSDQCLSNSLWAVAKLDLRGAANPFACSCVAQLRLRPPSALCPQALANSLWAVARLQLDPGVAGPFCVDVACRALASQDAHALGSFLSHELSMAFWAVAKIIRAPPPRSRRSHQAGRGLAAEVLEFADAVASEVCRRLSDFSPQSLSNVAWALVSMDLMQRPPARRFLLLVAECCGKELTDFPPQAIANLCWAFSKLHGSEMQVVTRFCALAAQEACTPRRAQLFTWQDHASILSALARLGLGREPAVSSFARWLVAQSAGCCREIGTQALLNIATSSIRLGISSEEMTPMAWGIAEAFTGRTSHLNDIDMRQWLQVQQHCGLPGARCRGLG